MIDVKTNSNIDNVELRESVGKSMTDAGDQPGLMSNNESMNKELLRASNGSKKGTHLDLNHGSTDRQEIMRVKETHSDQESDASHSSISAKEDLHLGTTNIQ